MLATLLSGGYIIEAEYRNTVIFNGVSPKLYGFVKIHKINYPLRPVESTFDFPTYKLSKFIAKPLRPPISNFPYIL